jgi:hypothetical protein
MKENNMGHKITTFAIVLAFFNVSYAQVNAVRSGLLETKITKTVPAAYQGMSFANISNNAYKLNLFRKNSSDIICTGVRIGLNWILTSAHCLQGDISSTAIFLGKEQSESNREAKNITVFLELKKGKNYFFNDDYNSDELEKTSSDMGLIYIQEEDFEIQLLKPDFKDNKTPDFTRNDSLTFGYGQKISSIIPKRNISFTDFVPITIIDIGKLKPKLISLFLGHLPSFTLTYGENVSEFNPNGYFESAFNVGLDGPIIAAFQTNIKIKIDDSGSPIFHKGGLVGISSKHSAEGNYTYAAGFNSSNMEFIKNTLSKKGQDLSDLNVIHLFSIYQLILQQRLKMIEKMQRRIEIESLDLDIEKNNRFLKIIEKLP